MPYEVLSKLTRLVERVRTVDAPVLFPVAGVAARQRAQRHQPRHEAQIWVRFAGPNKLVHLVSLGEGPLRLGRRVEVIAIGAELDTVLRADRVLQLWAAAEPGKVVEGLTVKQEMRAIKEAIAKRNREFLGQYGGLIQAGERYKELLTLPEAELAEGVSIDECSTYRATRFSEPV